MTRPLEVYPPCADPACPCRDESLRRKITPEELAATRETFRRRHTSSRRAEALAAGLCAVGLVAIAVVALLARGCGHG